MNLLSALTGLAKYAASISVGTVVGNLVAVTTPSNAKPITKLSIGFGTFILTGVISDMAMTYVETQINDIATIVITTKAKAKYEIENGAKKVLLEDDPENLVIKE